MKYIVVGLGRFGLKLASILTDMGHEVIGIDRNENNCEEAKDSVTTVMKMDCTNVNAIRSLPVNDMDCIIVAIGEDVGASVLTLSILKNLKVKRIIGRAINDIHHGILKQIGIEEIVHPLEDSAFHVSTMLQLKNVFRVIEISDQFAVAEVVVPERYVGHSIDTLNIQKRFDLKVIAVIKSIGKDSLSTILRRNCKVHLFFKDDEQTLASDILLIAGKIQDIKRFSES
jgi:trk system potassium uptake protein